MPAREVECAVLGNDDPVASVCGEIVPEGHAFYDYEAKYLDEDGASSGSPRRSRRCSPSEVQRMAVTAFRAASCAGMARVDLFLRGDEELWLNEINTIPGFTSISMYPKLWEASGLRVPGAGRAAARPRRGAVRGGARRSACARVSRQLNLGTAAAAGALRARGGRPGR